jgi:hypothetical protein
MEYSPTLLSSFMHSWMDNDVIELHKRVCKINYCFPGLGPHSKRLRLPSWPWYLSLPPSFSLWPSAQPQALSRDLHCGFHKARFRSIIIRPLSALQIGNDGGDLR